MAKTDNLDLEIQLGQEPFDIEVINRNMERIDTAFGKTITEIETFEEG